MTREAILGLDAGTTSAKAVVVAADGEVVAEATSEPILMLRPEPGAAEQEPAMLLQRIRQAMGDAVNRASGVHVSAVALAAQSGSVLAVDDDDRPIGNLVTWMDARASEVVEAWTEPEREAIRTISGWTAAPGLGLASIRWLRQRHPDRFDDATRWASVDDLVARSLTTVWRTNPSNAAGLQLMDVARLDWDERLTGLAGIRARQLSPIRRCGEVAGAVTAPAATRLGLEPGAPVIVGGHDQACAAFGLGMNQPGTMLLSAGTAWVLTAITRLVSTSRLRPGWNLSPHVADGLWSISRNLGGLGAGLELARTGRREALEPVAFAVRHALESIDVAGHRPEILTLVGGGSRSRVLPQLLADTTGVPVASPPAGSWPALGAARLGAAALGWPDPDHPSRSVEVLEPTPDPTGRRDARYRSYRRRVDGDST